MCLDCRFRSCAQPADRIELQVAVETYESALWHERNHIRKRFAVPYHHIERCGLRPPIQIDSVPVSAIGDPSPIGWIADSHDENRENGKNDRLRSVAVRQMVDTNENHQTGGELDRDEIPMDCKQRDPDGVGHEEEQQKEESDCWADRQNRSPQREIARRETDGGEYK